MPAEPDTGRASGAKRVLVTGAGGFVGRQALQPLLSLGFEVHAVGRGARPGWLTSRIAWHSCDLLDGPSRAALMEGVRPSHLLHFAWFTVHGEFWESVENVRWTSAALDLFLRFREQGGQRVVVAGTCAEYDWGHGFCSEEVTPLRPRTLYGTCKNAAREVLERLAARTGLGWAWGRIFLMYGPGEAGGRLIPSLIRPILEGAPAACGDGTAVRDFLHVCDVAEAFVALLDGDFQGVVNVASGVPVSVGAMIAAVASRLGRPDLVRLGALPPRPDEPPLLVADVRRLHAEVGWRPRLTLEEGLDRTIADYRGARS